MRVDKFLWCVRLFKTRSLAQKSCSAKHILVNDEIAKPSVELRENHRIAIKHGSHWRTYKVLDFPKSRVGAKLVGQFMVETTDPEILEQIEELRRINKQNRLSGIVGRPTKKQRRSLEDFSNQFKN